MLLRRVYFVLLFILMKKIPSYIRMDELLRHVYFVLHKRMFIRLYIRMDKFQHTVEWNGICLTREAASAPEFLMPMHEDIVVAGQCVAYTVAGMVQQGQDSLSASETLAQKHFTEVYICAFVFFFKQSTEGEKNRVTHKCLFFLSLYF